LFQCFIIDLYDDVYTKKVNKGKLLSLSCKPILGEGDPFNLILSGEGYFLFVTGNNS